MNSERGGKRDNDLSNTISNLDGCTSKRVSQCPSCPVAIPGFSRVEKQQQRGSKASSPETRSTRVEMIPSIMTINYEDVEFYTPVCSVKLSCICKEQLTKLLLCKVIDLIIDKTRTVYKCYYATLSRMFLLVKSVSRRLAVPLVQQRSSRYLSSIDMGDAALPPATPGEKTENSDRGGPRKKKRPGLLLNSRVRAHVSL
ncbi:hypothetical protein FGB62_44g04 [Gracilaria domingensis]|nr:hypothetical protein FGB62_44g04 [Gracilaria domingensis]